MSYYDLDKIKSKWQVKSSDEETIRFARKLACIFFSRVGDECVPELQQAVNAGDWLYVLDYSPDIVELGPERYRNVASALACFTKLECLPTGIDKEAVAYKKFLDGEYRCGIYNRIFERRLSGVFQFSTATEAILAISARKISRILGDCPSIKDVPIRLNVGGATTTIKKKDADLRNLIAGCMHCSEDLQQDEPKLVELLETLPHLVDIHLDAEMLSQLTIVTGRLDFVLKNAKTKRAITVEPDLNKIVQTAYGDYMRCVLKRSGIDLSDDQRQCELARIGSITGGIATLDLSNASGLISLGLILDQFPEPWLDVMLWCRTGEIYYHGAAKPRVLQSFAGMGNGLTFPVESLLFHAITAACCEYLNIKHPITSVYGDDIICSSEAAELVCKTLEEVGLKINWDKSFLSGPFRESCGSDWYSGYDVRPIFLRDNISLEHFYSLHNQLLAIGEEEVANVVLKEVPPELILFGPPGRGDGHVHSAQWKNAPTVRWSGKNGYSGYTYQTVSLEPRVSYVVTAYDRLVPLIMAHASDKIILPGDPEGYRALLGTDWVTPRSYLLWHREVLPDSIQGPVGRRISTSKKFLRSIAISMRDIKDNPVLEQSSLLRKRRGWKLRYTGISKPDPNLTVFGTPLPGSRSVRITTSYIFG